MKKRMIKMIVGAAVLLSASAAQAVAPANSTITNTASLTYTGLTTAITASVNVKVTLVPSKPILAGGTGSGSAVPADNTVAEGQPSKALYSLQAAANGPDTYNITQANTPSNITGAIAVSFKDTAAAPATITSVSLGATAAFALANAGANTITVPADGTANATLNGLKNGAFVVIGANTYVVNVTDSGTGTDTLALIAGTLPNGSAAPTVLAANVPVGTLIAELKVFSMNIANAGRKTAVATAAFVDVVTTATSVANTALKVSDTHRTNVVQVQFDKFVRNVTSVASNPAAGGVALGGATYYPTQATLVSSVSTDTLEYVIRVTAPTTIALQGVIVKDPMPTFTTYVGNSTRLNGITVNGDTLTASPLTAVNGLAVDDNTARAAGAVASGNIAATKVVLVTFQVTVD